MKYYWIRTHWLVTKLFPKFLWRMDPKEKTVYLTFDDGPIPEVTDFVLEQLDVYSAKATFFCIGQNIEQNPDLFRKVLAKGHAFGNHTFNHLNGWKTPEKEYLENVAMCRETIDSIAQDSAKLMRPPYAKVTKSQSRKLIAQGYKIVMWDILSADFDQTISPQKCLQNVLDNIRPGSIVIFHDSIKAFPNMKFALPETLKFLKENCFSCKALT